MSVIDAAPEQSIDEAMAAEAAADKRVKDLERMQMLGSRLQELARDQVAKRKVIEDRWIADLQQYHGQYPADTLAAIKAAGGSEIFTNITRPKTDTFSARLADMLLPTDDINWGIEPTPIPEVAAAMKDQRPLQTPDGKQVVTPDQNHPVTVQDMGRGIQDAVEEACKKMQEEMADQLQEAGYNGVQRDIIDDMARYGTGVLKGPTIVGKTRRMWMPVGDQHRLEVREDKRPAAMRVSPWDFFPDMSAIKLTDCEFILERHYFTRKQLRDLKKLPGFNEDALREVLAKGGPKFQTSTHMNRMRAIAGIESITDERFEVWEYHGPINKDDLAAAGVKVSEDDLVEMEGVIWFCEGTVLKAVLNPLDTEERPYSVCYCAKDDTSIFGFGYPYLLRAAQAVACASWRMVLDNAGLSTGPQVVIDRRAIVPMDGDYKMKPRKTYDFIGEGEIKQAFAVFNIDSHTEELIKIFEMSRQMGDDETNLPLIAQGSQSPTITKTAQGMSILMNAANVILRRAVKSYDDDITLTFLPRLYDWNMQFNPKREIKGDFGVIARGSSVLMEKEQQTQALLQSLGLFNNPRLAVWIEDEKYVTALMKNLRIDSVMRSSEDVKKILEQQAKNPPTDENFKNSREYLMMTLRQQSEELRTKLEMHNQTTSLAVQQMAMNMKMSADELRAKLGIKMIDVNKEISMFNAEMQAKYKFGEGI